MPVADVQSSAVVCAEEVGEDPSMDDLPDEVTVAVGDEALVRLPSLAAAGYKWEATADDPRIVEVSIRFEDAPSAGVGSPPAFGAHELLVLTGRTSWQNDGALFAAAQLGSGRTVRRARGHGRGRCCG